MTRRGIILFAALGLIWGIPYLFIKVAVTELTPEMLVLSRSLLAAVILLPLAAWRRELAPVLRRWRPLAAFAVVEIVLPWYFLGSAETSLPSSTTGLLLAAVPLAAKIFSDAIREMSVDDARSILTGGDDAATQYFKRTTSKDIGARFLPIVKTATAKVDLAGQYNKYAGQAAKLGLMSEQDADLDTYVTQKAMDGLFLMIAEQEKAIRKDPIGTGSSMLKKVFSALGK